MFKIQNSKTKEIKEYRLIDPKSGVCYLGDFIGNFLDCGEWMFNELEEVYALHPDDLEWWETRIEEQQLMTDKQQDLKEEYGSEAVYQMLQNMDSGDLEDEYYRFCRAVDELIDTMDAHEKNRGEA